MMIKLTNDNNVLLLANDAVSHVRASLSDMRRPDDVWRNRR